ncbi:MAG: ABC transporter substrate-binding protein [Betaproteobacteria bacterium RIFCSPLOWO2_12_FULL_65_110]|nr:MAG: ABC transporter substrate-binding protein [Betaproteobacteria bacterium RIFCSPLOWO2_02_FULL_65_20]OGA40012.1 MAG: ABC transporter substrate-binding protein [Betaproteobacteria bacterium RIFCSPLOWO2_12_FULL_65_110]
MNKLYAALAILAGLTGNALAQTASTAPSRATGTGDWPAKAMHMIVPFPPGSSPDLIARMLGEKLGTALGQPVIVENRPGAGGNLGTALVARAAPDGYTIGLSIGGPLAVNTVLYSKLPYDPFTDLAPITLVAASPNVLVVDPKLGVGSVKEFVALAKSQPGKLNYGSVGNGSASHLTMELLKAEAGIDIVHVPYPGSPQVNTAIAGGQIAAGFVVPATAMPLVQGGRMKALAVTSSARSAVLPELPTVAEAGFPGFQSTAWLGMVAPARTPEPIVERISAELVRIIRSDEIRGRMARIYFQAIGTTPAGLATLMRDEVERWGKVIRQTGAKAD